MKEIEKKRTPLEIAVAKLKNTRKYSELKALMDRMERYQLKHLCFCSNNNDLSLFNNTQSFSFQPHRHIYPILVIVVSAPVACFL